jgi:hypothetical protein
MWSSKKSSIIIITHKKRRAGEQEVGVEERLAAHFLYVM